MRRDAASTFPQRAFSPFFPLRPPPSPCCLWSNPSIGSDLCALCGLCGTYYPRSALSSLRALCDLCGEIKVARSEQSPNIRKAARCRFHYFSVFFPHHSALGPPSSAPSSLSVFSVVQSEFRVRSLRSLRSLRYILSAIRLQFLAYSSLCALCDLCGEIKVARSEQSPNPRKAARRRFHFSAARLQPFLPSVPSSLSVFSVVQSEYRVRSLRSLRSLW